MLYKMKKNLNQKLINLIEYYNLINSNLLLSDMPLNRSNKVKTTVFTKNIIYIFNNPHRSYLETSASASGLRKSRTVGNVPWDNYGRM